MEDSPRDGSDQVCEIEVEVGPVDHSMVRRFRPGNGRLEWFKDLDVSPEMVVAPAGSFIMGAADDEIGINPRSERPAHRVTIARPFAIGRFTVTFDEWDAAAERGGVRHLADHKGWGRGRRPAYPLSWEDGQAYVSWLSRATECYYRLPTEAEWEYAARAGTRTKFWWGNDFCPVLANLRVHHGPIRSAAQLSDSTVPVDFYTPNPWDLHQVHGNVEEWCEDAYQATHRGYRGASTDGSAWQRTDQRYRVKRDSSYGSHPIRARSAKRTRNRADTKSGGIRVVRSLEV